MDEDAKTPREQPFPALEPFEKRRKTRRGRPWLRRQSMTIPRQRLPRPRRPLDGRHRWGKGRHLARDQDFPVRSDPVERRPAGGLAFVPNYRDHQRTALALLPPGRHAGWRPVHSQPHLVGEGRAGPRPAQEAGPACGGEMWGRRRNNKAPTMAFYDEEWSPTRRRSDPTCKKKRHGGDRDEGTKGNHKQGGKAKNQEHTERTRITEVETGMDGGSHVSTA